MTALPLRVLLGLALLAGGAGGAYAAVSCWVLGNGLRVVAREDHSFPVVAINLVVRGGAAIEPESQAGISHLLEHMLFKGTASRGRGELQRDIESMGGVVNGGATRDYTRVYATVGSRFLPEALELLADAAASPALDAVELGRERLVVMDEARLVQDDPLAMLWDAAFGAAFRTHPYRRPMGGTTESLGSLERADLVAWHRTTFTPANMSLVLVGDFDPQRALLLVSETFGKQAAGLRPVACPASEPFPPATTLVRHLKGDQEWFMLAFPAPGADTWDEVPAMDLLAGLLGTGYACRLSPEWQQAHGLHGLRVQYLTHRRRSLLGIAAACPPGQWRQGAQAIHAEISRLVREPIPGAELERAKGILAGHFALANESFADQADTLGFYEAIGSYTWAAEYTDKLNRLTPAQIQRLAGRYLDATHCTTVVCTP